jgi:hypothetical protein
MSDGNVMLLIVFGSWTIIMITVAFSPNQRRSKIENNSATQNNNTPPHRTIWDKLKIVALVISSIAALIIALIKLYEVFNKD